MLLKELSTRREQMGAIWAKTELLNNSIKEKEAFKGS